MERLQTTIGANANPHQMFTGRHGSCKRPRHSYMCKGGSFAKYHGLKKKATVGWKSGGYVGVCQDWACGERSPNIITKIKVKPPGARTCTG
jgi:hypothetical protein